MEDHQAKYFKEAMTHIASDEYGIAFFKFLNTRCNFQNSSITRTADGKVDTDAMIMKEANRNLWLEIRNYLPKEKLALIELDAAIHVPQPAENKSLENTSIWTKTHQMLAQRTPQLPPPLWEPETP